MPPAEGERFLRFRTLLGGLCVPLQLFQQQIQLKGFLFERLCFGAQGGNLLFRLSSAQERPVCLLQLDREVFFPLPQPFPFFTGAAEKEGLRLNLPRSFSPADGLRKRLPAGLAPSAELPLTGKAGAQGALVQKRPRRIQVGGVKLFVQIGKLRSQLAKAVVDDPELAL